MRTYYGIFCSWERTRDTKELQVMELIQVNQVEEINCPVAALYLHRAGNGGLYMEFMI
ncbi:hypothetical protein KDI_25900 [Dictyobacter arantiisoli]|uniref:Uncharacterized protein n=1 Tax=Dictyobacter arantiisoli TaxID=2014874 RepID=A0A5A5TCZ1_9CHLR|nr:hypothetical protein KDI_25900 [Dictyobacter arantiisoli]